MNRAAQKELQQSEQVVTHHYAAPIELAYRGRGRFWLGIGSALVFCVGFIGHQAYLYQNPPQLVVPAATNTQVDSGVPQDQVLQSARSENNVGSKISLSTSPVVGEQHNGEVSVEVVRPHSEEQKAAELIGSGAGQVAQVPESLQSSTLEPQALKHMQLVLLQRNAAAALERDRLLTPAHDNAVFYFNAMLALDQDNAAATEGLQAVAARYILFYERLMSRGDEYAAAQMLTNAEQVYPGSTALLAKPAAGQPVRNPAPQAAASTSTVAAQSSVTLSAASQKARLLNQVLSLSQRGQHGAIVTLLEPEIDRGSTDPGFLAALHAAYIATGNLPKAQRLSQQAGMAPHVASLMRAQESIAEKDFISAIGELESTPPSPTENPDYFTVLAGLYYETGRHEDSQYLYRELLKHDASNGRWWLGYAVASDALHHSDTLMAYQGALKYLAKSDSARQYAEERVSQLSGTQGYN